MALDESRLRAIIREEREAAKREDEREARDKQRDEEIADLRKLVGRKGKSEDDGDADDHEPVL